MVHTDHAHTCHFAYQCCKSTSKDSILGEDETITSPRTQQSEKLKPSCYTIEPDIRKAPGIHSTQTEYLNLQALCWLSFSMSQIGHLPLITHHLHDASENTEHTSGERECSDRNTNPYWRGLT